MNRVSENPLQQECIGQSSASLSPSKVINMKRIFAARFVAVSFLILSVATVGPAYAQKEHRDEDARTAKPQHGQREGEDRARPHSQQARQPQQQPDHAKQQQSSHPQQQQSTRPAQQHQSDHARQQQPAQQQRPQSQHQQDRIQQHAGAYPVQERTRQQARGWQQQRGWFKQGAWQGSNSWQNNRAHDWQGQHRTWDQRGGYGGYYIPQARFVLSFGSQHWFRITSRPIIVGGYPRFQYGGFSFMLVDPWPEGWSEDWYTRDDVYVDYDNGYYLHDRRDPGIRLAISVVL